ncbi:UDP-N-acetylmuramoyl-L-alanyl-D-glutamate--2,6-diaminopimelate ligase [Peribacillus sp. SCS-37]|uniref:UDP-N-acetylmuramoyl-L-alanyl-D-glutamate--2, 6-diaminopimelate ligase n=1 Tax=Paraperibacillus esterisolvens TaxID=3115296 RepID=UPI0039060B51
MYIHFGQHRQLAVRKIWGEPERDISSICYDSRRAAEGSIFVCISGENHDGHTYIADAAVKGASVIAGSDPEKLAENHRLNPAGTFLLVDDPRSFLAHISILYYEEVHERLLTVGVTGTNGKTTVAAYVRSLMTNLGMPAGYIGTIGVLSSQGRIDFSQTTPTTPESLDLHYIFKELDTLGDKLAAMEVTSVALEQKRVEGIEFDVAIHTNLSPEHLEFHHTYENYKNAKLKLFRQAKKAVVNVDDSGMAADILEEFDGPVLTYSLEADAMADVKAVNIMLTEEGAAFDLMVGEKSYPAASPIFGDYNVANLLSAVCTALHAGFPIEEIIPALEGIDSPEGRLEVLQEYGGRKIILDYAHTPPALINLIKEVKKMPHRRLVVMITGIGIRDREKMPKMAEAIEGLADEIIVSVDHPGFDDPHEIVSHVLTGFSNPSAGNIHTAPTRQDGVMTALAISGEKDIIVLTSGCINGAQLVKGEKVPHSDKDVIRNYFDYTESEPDIDFARI